MTDPGLANFKDFKNLTEIGLSHTKVTDTGSGQLQGLQGLARPRPPRYKCEPYRTGPFKDCPLTLDLHDSTVNDEALANLKEFKNLSAFALDSHKKVTDAGLTNLKNCKNLTHLWLHKTKVTAAGIDELNKELPQCKIEWDGGVVEAGMGWKELEIRPQGHRSSKSADFSDAYSSECGYTIFTRIDADERSSPAWNKALSPSSRRPVHEPNRPSGFLLDSRPQQAA